MMDFKFVNITEPSQSRDPAVLKGVRQHVQKPGRKKSGGYASRGVPVKWVKAKRPRPKSSSPEAEAINEATSSAKRLRTDSFESTDLNVPTHSIYSGSVVSSANSPWPLYDVRNTPSPLMDGSVPGTNASPESTSSCYHNPLAFFPCTASSPVASASTYESDNASSYDTPFFHSSISNTHLLLPAPTSSSDPSSFLSWMACTTELASPPLYRPIGEGFDPFDSLPKSNRVVLPIQRLKSNCVIIFGSESLRRYWIPHALQDRTFFLSTLSLPAEHEDMLLNRIHNPVTTALRDEVTRLLQERLSDPRYAFDDYTAATLAHVGFAGNYTAEDTILDFNYDCLRQIVEARGGCHAFDRFISKTMVIIALESAIFRNTEPHACFTQGAERILTRRNNKVTQLESPICYNAQTGFSILRRSTQCCNRLFDLLQRMKQLGECITNSTGRSSPDRYNLQRDEIRQYVIALPSAHQTGFDITGDWIYESCRLTAIIFERACYKRQPLSAAVVGTNLMPQLQAALQKTDLEERWGDMTGVLFWCAMIGATAGHCSTERRWFVGVATRVTILHAFETGIWIVAALHKLTELQRWWNEGSHDAGDIFDMDEVYQQPLAPMSGNMADYSKWI